MECRGGGELDELDKQTFDIITSGNFILQIDEILAMQMWQLIFHKDYNHIFNYNAEHSIIKFTLFNCQNIDKLNFMKLILIMTV